MKLWDAATGQELLTLKSDTWAGAHVQGFSSDGNFLFAKSPFFSRVENRLHIWDATLLPDEPR